MFGDTFERIGQLFQLAVVIAQQLPREILDSREKIQQLIDNPGGWGPRLRQTFSVVAAEYAQRVPVPSKYVVVRDEVTGYDTITVRVGVKRPITGRAMLAATGRVLHASDASIATMPLVGGEGEEVVEFVWFCPERALDDAEVEPERRQLGLTRDIQAQAQANADDPAFADTHWNGDSWQDADKLWHYVSFDRDVVGRRVYCGRGRSGWTHDRWFGGSRKSFAA